MIQKIEQASRGVSKPISSHQSQRPKKVVEMFDNISGQIIATSHDLTPNGGFVREIPLFQGNLGW